ncbi:MAG: glycosyltransferase family 2 protein [Sulfurimonadaceae bacterium]
MWINHLKKNLLSIVCPCYNEEKNLEYFSKELFDTLQELDLEYEVIFVNDGSNDATLEKLKELKSIYSHIKIISLSRNFGKEAALSAGIDKAKGDVLVPIDADMQHPPHVIKDLYEEWQKGYDVVLAKRKARTTESFLKKVNAYGFYKLHNMISNIKIPQNVGDFRLISRKVVEAVKKLPENQRFMKGVFAWVGFKTSIVEYEVNSRAYGKSSFSGWKLWNFALEGICSFSTVPLRIWLYIGVVLSFSSFLYMNYIIIQTLVFGVDAPGYASLMSVVLFLGGIQLIGIGVLGEYIGRIYMESKKRPIYIIDEEL